MFCEIYTTVMVKDERNKTRTSKQERMAKILMIIAPVQFRDEELLEPKKLFEAEGHEVVIASTSMKAKGKLGAEVDTDILLKTVKVDDYDCIVLVGGRGILDIKKETKEIIQKGFLSNKVMACICIAGRIFAEYGLLKGKRATVHNTDESLAILKKNGAEYVDEDVVVEEKLVTANGPAAAKEFAQEIIRQI